jgi:hypothetical protein
VNRLQILEMVQRALAMGAPVGGTQILTVDLAASIPAGASVIRQAEPLQFQEPGTVVAITGQEVTATSAKYATTRLSLAVGPKELVSNGQGKSFASFLTLFPPGQPFWGLFRDVQVGVPWIFSFENRDAGAVCVPSLTLGFIAEADMRRLMAG